MQNDHAMDHEVEQYSEIIPLKDEWKRNAIITKEKYEQMYKQSIENNEEFWREHGKRIDWFTPYNKVSNWKFSTEETYIKWFEDGETNVSYNCIDRHLEKNGDDVAIIWQGNPEDAVKKYTYNQLHKEVCKLANGLKQIGIKKGDVVTIYMPMIPELAFSMLACTRIGAIHSVVFGGFSAESVAGRIDNCGSKYILTADAGVRGAKAIPLKNTIDNAVKLAKEKIQKVVVVKTQQNDYYFNPEIDIYYHDLVKDQSEKCECEVMNAEDPLFILYTSGSTGTPKGILHTTGGYLVYASMTHEFVFNYKKGDVYWCTADFGWITGHSYGLYGPLCNGATTLIYEGVPNYPDYSRWWQIIDKFNVAIFYTAPTAIRALMCEGDELVKKTKRNSLKLLATVGEPINPKAWKWYYSVGGEEKCPVIDTWWQTETGGHMITPLPGTFDLKPGFAATPFFGVNPGLIDEERKVIEGEGSGHLVIKQSWPGQARTIWGNHQRFLKTYFSQFNGCYFPQDGCERDKDGFYRITGRIDDILIVSGHNLATAELESAITSHELVSEAAVVGYPHEIKGSGLYVFVILQSGVTPSKELEKEITLHLRQKVGPIAHPDYYQFVPGLPKTRSGKIMRRILRKIVEGFEDQLGDISTLADKDIVQNIIENRIKIHH